VARTTAAADGDSVATTNQVVEAAAGEVVEMVDQFNVHPRESDWRKPIVTAEGARIARRRFYRRALTNTIRGGHRVGLGRPQ
jgi:hypothetical protein